MGKRSRMPDHEVNLLLTSGLILLICLILAAVCYFVFTLEIIDPPGISDAPHRVGVSESGNSGHASPDGSADLFVPEEETEAADIIFPNFVDFSITDGIDTVELKNYSQNTVSLSFTLTDRDGQVLYEASSVQPGESQSWKVTDSFDPGTGEHAVTVTIRAFSLSDGEALNGISSTFTVDLG